MTRQNHEDDDFDDLDGDNFDPSIVADGEDAEDLSAKVKHIRQNIGTDEPIKIRLQKREGTKWSYIDELDTEDPSTHEIGIKHGGGEYRLYITWLDAKSKKTKTATHRFVLGRNYDRLRKEQEAHDNFMTSSGDKIDRLLEVIAQPKQDKSMELMITMMQSQSNQFQTMMLENARQQQEAQRRAEESRTQLLTTLATVLAPVLSAVVNKPAPTVPEPRESLADKLLPTLIEKLSEKKETQSPIAQLKEMKELMDMIKPETSAPEKTWIDVIENLASTVVENAPLILSAFTPKALVQQTMNNQIAQNPEIGEVLKDDEKFIAFVRTLREKLGDDNKVRIILEKGGNLDRAISLGAFNSPAQITA